MTTEIKDIIKEAITTDLLHSDDDKISEIRVKIIEDRKYNLPYKMYDYIQERDVITLIKNFFTTPKLHDFYEEDFKLFLSDVVMMDILTKHHGIANLIVKEERRIPDICSIGYIFPAEKLCKYFKTTHITTKFIVKIMKSYIDNKIEVPSCYVNLYFTELHSKFWKFSKRRIKDGLICKLLDDIALVLHTTSSMDHLTYILPAIYKVFKYKESDYMLNIYTKYLTSSKGSKFILANQYPLYYAAYYINDYVSHTKCHYKEKMDKAIKPFLYDNAMIAKMEKCQIMSEGTLRMLLIDSVFMNVNNIEFIYWDLKKDEYHRNTLITLIVSTDQKIDNIEYVIKKLFQDNVNDILVRAILFKYLQNHGNVYNAEKYIRLIINDVTNVMELVNILDEDNLSSLLVINPTLNNSSNISFVDIIMQNLHLLSVQNMEKVRKAFSSDVNAYNSLYISDRNALFKGKNNFYNVAAKYPEILSYDKELSPLDISEIYKRNQNTISYINPLLLKEDMIYNHSLKYGYTELFDIQSIGFEHIMEIPKYLKLLESDLCYGYLIDFSNIAYTNACIICILNKKS